MNKLKTIKIAIPGLCSQNWDKMKSAEKGKFCNHCQKIVIDFTTWTDNELYDFFSKSGQRVCGRFLKSQTDRTINIPPQPGSKLYRITIALGLTIMICQSHNLMAQSKNPLTVLQDSFRNTGSNANLLSGLKGTIADEDKEPMVNAIVRIFQNGILKGGAATGFDGNYSVNCEAGLYDILVSCVGYDTIKEKGVLIRSNETIFKNFTFRKSQINIQDYPVYMGPSIIEMTEK